MKSRFNWRFWQRSKPSQNETPADAVPVAPPTSIPSVAAPPRDLRQALSSLNEDFNSLNDQLLELRSALHGLHDALKGLRAGSSTSTSIKIDPRLN